MPTETRFFEYARGAANDNMLTSHLWFKNCKVLDIPILTTCFEYLLNLWLQSYHVKLPFT